MKVSIISYLHVPFFIFIQPFYQPRLPSALFFNQCCPPSICFYQSPSALAFHASQCLQDDQKAARQRSKDPFICQSLSTYQISDLTHGKSRAFGKQARWCIKCLTAEGYFSNLHDVIHFSKALGCCRAFKKYFFYFQHSDDRSVFVIKIQNMFTSCKKSKSFGSELFPQEKYRN